jgi:hypothetical protein
MRLFRSRLDNILLFFIRFTDHKKGHAINLINLVFLCFIITRK